MHTLLWMNVMHDFICSGFSKLWGMGREPKIQKENICLQQDFEPTSDVLLNHVNLIQCPRPLGYPIEMFKCLKLSQYHRIQLEWIHM